MMSLCACAICTIWHWHRQTLITLAVNFAQAVLLTQAVGGMVRKPLLAVQQLHVSSLCQLLIPKPGWETRHGAKLLYLRWQPSLLTCLVLCVAFHAVLRHTHVACT